MFSKRWKEKGVFFTGARRGIQSCLKRLFPCLTQSSPCGKKYSFQEYFGTKQAGRVCFRLEQTFFP